MNISVYEEMKENVTSFSYLGQIIDDDRSETEIYKQNRDGENVYLTK